MCVRVVLLVYAHSMQCVHLDRLCVCVCVCVREREREGVCVCLCNVCI